MATVSDINLDRVEKRVEKRLGWQRERVVEAVAEYRKFLLLCKEHPTIPHIPCRDVDEIWHAHILDTRAYADDCAAVFGKFVHHRPTDSDDEDGDGGADNGHSQYRIMLDRYRDTFGEPPAMWTAEGECDECHSINCNMACQAAPCNGPADCRDDVTS